jgi:phage shock protein PspC (stress-responsive transcriptional regulator)
MTTIQGFFQSESWQKLRDVSLPEDDWVIGGVCSAFGKATPFAAWMWRVFFLTTLFAWGFGIGAYITLWICIPEEKA